MNDDELRDALRGEVPPPAAGYWDRIDAMLEAAAGGQQSGSKASSGEMETPGEVIRLTDMNEQQPTPAKSTLLAAAALVAVVGVGAVAFAVTGNDSDPNVLLVSDDSSAPIDSEAPPPATDLVDTVLTEVTVPDPSIPSTASPTTTDDTTTTSSTSIAPAPLPLVTPETLQGEWREVDGSEITADDCRQGPDAAENFGRVLTVRESGFSIFETGGILLEVHEVSATRLDATYDTTSGDTPTQERLIFDAPGDGSVLSLSSVDGSGPTVQYARCPDPSTATPEPSDTTAPTTDAALPMSFPDSMLGAWRESDAETVTAAECRVDAYSYDNYGFTMEVRNGGFVYFEFGGDIIEVFERTDTRIDALFVTNFVGDESVEEERRTFELQENGTSLIVTSGVDGVPSRYLPCPA